MNYRNYVLLDREAANSGTTKTVDLKGLDPISRLEVGFRITNQSSVPTGHPAYALKTIQVIDGSQVIANLTGAEAIALDFYHNSKEPQNMLDYTSGDICEAVAAINFGRYLFDPDLALDPSKFSNPQLKIVHDLTLGGAGTPTAAALSVHLRLFDGKVVTPSGYLMNKEFNSYTLSASAKQTVEMPNDYPLRMLMLHSTGLNKQPWEQYNWVKLSENNDKKIPLDMRTSDILKNVNPIFGRYGERITGTLTTGSVRYYITPSFETGVVVLSQAAATTAIEALYPYGGSVMLQGEAADLMQGLVHGYNPMGCMAIPMGNLMDENDWYDLHTITDLKMYITAGSAPNSNSTCETVLQQLVKY